MPETPVKDQIRNLIELQKLDKEIYEKRMELQEKPAFVEVLKGQFERKKLTLNQLEEKAKAIQLKRKEKELELKQKEEGIIKANGALNAIKTNREYTAKITEIEGLKADIAIIEEKILEFYDQGDQINAEVDKEKIIVGEEEKKYLAKKSEVEADVKVVDDRIKVLEGQRKQLTPAVDKNILKPYEAILQKKEGLAIVAIKGTSCGGCFMNITPQGINTIRMGQEYIQCDFCTRILYIEEDL